MRLYFFLGMRNQHPRCSSAWLSLRLACMLHAPRTKTQCPPACCMAGWCRGLCMPCTATVRHLCLLRQHISSIYEFPMDPPTSNHDLQQALDQPLNHNELGVIMSKMATITQPQAPTAAHEPASKMASTSPRSRTPGKRRRPRAAI